MYVEYEERENGAKMYTHNSYKLDKMEAKRQKRKKKKKKKRGDLGRRRGSLNKEDDQREKQYMLCKQTNKTTTNKPESNQLFEYVVMALQETNDIRIIN